MDTLWFIRKLPMRKKLTLLLLAPCIAVLLIAGAVLAWYQLNTFRTNFERDLSAAAYIVANNVSTAITSNDEAAANEILKAFRAKEHVTRAILLTGSHRVFAQYSSLAAESTPELESTLATETGVADSVFRGNNLIVSMPVRFEGRQIATLHVVSNFREVYASLFHFTLCILGLVVLTAALIAGMISTRLQRFVTDPILDLAETARKVADEGNYSVRAEGADSGEFGVLKRAFNRMLAQIQIQAGELQTASMALVDKIYQLEHQISERERAEQELEKVHKQLVTSSRQAGMAEVASGVLHNVGNVLNSLNISASLINDHLASIRADQLARASSMVAENLPNIGAFMLTDSKGKLIPEFLRTYAANLDEHKKEISAEMESLCKNIEHIKEIVAMQQSYARVAGVVEDLPVIDLIEDALRIHAGAFARHGVSVKRQFSESPIVRVDKHKVLQILVNLFRNAKYAMDATGRTDKTLTVSVHNGGTTARVLVADNGIGIPRENLTRIFQHGFTTKSDGHGFGLHSGALAAQDLGGSLVADSGGPGQGATFTLELPIGHKGISHDNLN